MNPAIHELAQIPDGSATIAGLLEVPPDCRGIVLFAHGSGSSRLSPRNNFVARALRQMNIGTLLMDLLTTQEDETYVTRFDIALLTRRLMVATAWLQKDARLRGLPLGFFGASTGAAAALQAAARLGRTICAVVSRGGRPDLAGDAALRDVQSPTLLLVGGHDEAVIRLNRTAYDLLRCPRQLAIIPGATHLFEEPGALEQVAQQAGTWFARYFEPAGSAVGA